MHIAYSARDFQCMAHAAKVKLCTICTMHVHAQLTNTFIWGDHVGCWTQIGQIESDTNINYNKSNNFNTTAQRHHRQRRQRRPELRVTTIMLIFVWQPGPEREDSNIIWKFTPWPWSLECICRARSRSRMKKKNDFEVFYTLLVILSSFHSFNFYIRFVSFQLYSVQKSIWFLLMLEINSPQPNTFAWYNMPARGSIFWGYFYAYLLVILFVHSQLVRNTHNSVKMESEKQKRFTKIGIE